MAVHCECVQLLLKGGQWVSQLGDKIPQPVVATIAHYLLLIVFVGGIAIGVGFLIFLGASKVFEFYTEDYADTMSLAVFLISLAVSVLCGAYKGGNPYQSSFTADTGTYRLCADRAPLITTN